MLQRKVVFFCLTQPLYPCIALCIKQPDIGVGDFNFSQSINTGFLFTIQPPKCLTCYPWSDCMLSVFLLTMFWQHSFKISFVWPQSIDWVDVNSGCFISKEPSNPSQILLIFYKISYKPDVIHLVCTLSIGNLSLSLPLIMNSSSWYTSRYASLYLLIVSYVTNYL